MSKKKNECVDPTPRLPVDRAADDATEHPQIEEADLSPAEDAFVSRSIDRFMGLIDRELDEKLDDEEVHRRLQEVRRRVDRWSGGSCGDRPLDTLARNGYYLVRLWLQLVAAIEPHQVRLATGAIDEITKETVAQALNLVSDQSAAHDWDATFVARCIELLPQAYRSWSLGGGTTLTAENLEKAGSAAFGAELVDSLRRCISSPQASQLLRGWEHVGDIEDPLQLTHRAFQLLSDTADQEQGRG